MLGCLSCGFRSNWPVARVVKVSTRDAEQQGKDELTCVAHQMVVHDVVPAGKGTLAFFAILFPLQAAGNELLKRRLRLSPKGLALRLPSRDIGLVSVPE